MIVNHPDLKVIYIHLAKCGGSSITKSIAKHLGVSREKYRPLQHKFLFSKNLTYEQWRNYFVFSIVRHPYARIVSFYYYLQQVRKPPNNLSSDVTFDRWINKNGYLECPQMYPQITIDGKLDERIHFGTLENIDRNWKIICDKLGVDIPLIHDKATIHPPYYEIISRLLAPSYNKVKEYCKKDIELYNDIVVRK